MICVYVYGCLPKNQEGNISSLLQVNPPYMFVSQQTAVCLQSRRQPRMLTTGADLVQKCSVLAKIGVDQDHKQIISELIFFWTETTSSNWCQSRYFGCARVLLLCSYVPKQTARWGKTNQSLIQLNRTRQVWQHLKISVHSREERLSKGILGRRKEIK